MHLNSTFRFAAAFAATALLVSPLAAQRPATTTSSAARFKAIWEPVNYKQDLELQSVYFVTPDIGWVSGAGGTILKTTDGGTTWTPQLGGDPQNDARRISGFRFVDQNNGFAYQGTGVGDWVLLHTTDGVNW